MNTPEKDQGGMWVEEVLNLLANARAKIEKLRAELKAEAERSATYKRIAERNHRANMMPCPDCGYVPATIHAAQAKESGG